MLLNSSGNIDFETVCKFFDFVGIERNMVLKKKITIINSEYNLISFVKSFFSKNFDKSSYFFNIPTSLGNFRLALPANKTNKLCHSKFYLFKDM
ncbi:hypothetical protein FACS189459_5150 [Bacilli bacterium]|nr:hypothetical protein FACS189459_5150 [Bacilli bacterium]